MKRSNTEITSESVDDDSRFNTLLEEAIGPRGALCEVPGDLADRIVAETCQKLSRGGVVGSIGPAAIALRWSMALAASVLLALSASLWIAGLSGTGEVSVHLTADAMDREIENLEADIDSLLTGSAWEMTYSELEEELAEWEFSMGNGMRMDQF